MIWRGGLAAATALALAACLPAPAMKPAPKPQPEPPQAPPSAAALGPVKIAEEACAEPPRSGEVLEGAVAEDGPHFYEVRSDTDLPAIVKVRREGGPLVAAVYVGPGKTVQIGPLVDGTYRLSYALGRALTADCRHLDYPSDYGQEPKPEVFVTGEEEGRQVGRTANLTLNDRESEGPQALTAEKFNAP